MARERINTWHQHVAAYWPSRKTECPGAFLFGSSLFGLVMCWYALKEISHFLAHDYLCDTGIQRSPAHSQRTHCSTPFLFPFWNILGQLLLWLIRANPLLYFKDFEENWLVSKMVVILHSTPSSHQSKSFKSTEREWMRAKVWVEGRRIVINQQSLSPLSPRNDD